MSSAYAGVLGFLAFFVTIARGAIDGQDTTDVVPHACLMMAVFAAVGFLAGKIGQSAVEGSVEQNLRAEVEACQAAAGDVGNGEQSNKVKST